MSVGVSSRRVKIATFNINSIRNRFERLTEWLAESKPDVVCLQELRIFHEEFPLDAIKAAGYGALWQGQKPRFNGVAILARGAEPVVSRRAARRCCRRRHPRSRRQPSARAPCPCAAP